MESINDNYESNKKSITGVSDKNKLHDKDKYNDLSKATTNTQTKKISNKESSNLSIVNTKRCNFIDCKRKLGIMPYDCKCGGLFCGLHQYGWEHKCSFNFKEENKDILSNRLVKLEKSKLNKI